MDIDPSFERPGLIFRAKDATKDTIDANKLAFDSLDFGNTDDFANAMHNRLAKESVVTIAQDDPAKKVPAWDLEKYKKYMDEDNDGTNTDYPPSVNPSLWRNAQLCLKNGLFEVSSGTMVQPESGDPFEVAIYQIRGYDLSNTTFVRGQTGWIIIDTLTARETAAAAWALLKSHFPEERPIKAIIYSHSHVDHFGGARGFFSTEEELRDVEVIAPADFTEHAVSENVIAGNAMGRRSVYMYGSMLPRNEKGGVNAGLGMAVSSGSRSMLLPTKSITEDQTYPVDGVVMEFQCTPGTEAPSEMNTYFPQMKALWMAENTTNTMHNVITLRGAQVRDSRKWATYINQTIERFGADSVVKFQSHHWPIWGNENIIPYLKMQRDCYKYTHDQTVRLMNEGYIGSEISEKISLPASLETNWNTRGYYGTLRHNSHAVYQFYMGWYSGNPSDLNNRTPVDAANRYVRYMGGVANIMENAQKDYDDGDYRWVSEVMKHVVFADHECTTDITAAKELLADAYEQLGYQAESGAWRGVYLQGALELRHGVPKSLVSIDRVSPDVVANMSVEMMFDYFAVQLLPDASDGKEWCMYFFFSDLEPETDDTPDEQRYTLTLSNCVLNTLSGYSGDADLVVTLEKTTLNDMMTGQISTDDGISQMTLDGDAALLTDLFGNMIKKPEFWFNIVTP